MNHDRAPLFEALQAHRQKHTASYHVPGHKSGRGMMQEERDLFHPILQIDLTEITGLDDLHHPEECIREAQLLAADAFGADETYFLVGGSTAGNLASVLALCGEGDTLIVERGSHKSVMNGLMLAKAKAVFLPQTFEPDVPIPQGPSIEIIRQALEMYPEAKGVLLTAPNYYGYQMDLRRAAELVHTYGKILIVDEAHGAHLGFHGELPPSALSCGADVVIQSTHKMLTAMTMGAMLHVKGKRGLELKDQIKRFLAMLQSSSPSYPIMASLDIARRYIMQQGKDVLEDTLHQIQSFYSKLSKLSVLWHAHSETYKVPGFIDPMKCYIADTTGTLSGHQLRKLLEAEGCIMEMSDASGTLAVFSLCTEEEHLQRLLLNLQQIVEKYGLVKKEVHGPLWNCFTREEQLLPIDMGLASTEAVEIVPLDDAVGCKSADMVIPYPPGIPLWVPGEVITAQSARDLQHWIQQGGHVQGMAGAGLIKVIKR
ncbi:aminotransferase class I/II-fold pyridoxal phosphate-dependent enzyme [Marinicrinis lubricantis]|uniref:Aminotransferase class I/II-fold pyridoxal phosphate-dependent enzyme n=1 Tax=Marinicrinis lubricantis TaxID=2086470 RepID=A0ABW1IQ96_9BACL